MIVIDIIVYVAIGGLLSWFFYFLRKKDLLGGFIGGLIVGFLGAVLGGLALSLAVEWLIAILQKGAGSNVNIIASLIGGYVALYIFNKINHDRTRKDF